MGAPQSTPARCPLCDEQTGNPVTLKCNHSFCQRCIGDLWSVNPNGPYHCPEWKCKTLYHTLPFDSSLIGHRPHANKRSAPSARSAAGKRDNSPRLDVLSPGRVMGPLATVRSSGSLRTCLKRFDWCIRDHLTYPRSFVGSLQQADFILFTLAIASLIC